MHWSWSQSTRFADWIVHHISSSPKKLRSSIRNRTIDGATVARYVTFLLLRIVSLQKTMGGDDIARTDVKAELMGDQGMADAVVPLSDDCLGFQIYVDCRMYQEAKEAQQPYGVPISNHWYASYWKGYPCVLCYILQAFCFVTCRLRFVVSWIWSEKHRGYIWFPASHTSSIRCSIEKFGEELCLLSVPYWRKATFVAQKWMAPVCRSSLNIRLSYLVFPLSDWLRPVAEKLRAHRFWIL